LPEQHTDFIFAVLAEEGGFVAALLLVALYATLLLRLLFIAERASTRFGALVVFGIATMLFVNAFVNLAMTMGLVPVVGVPLPLVSYGGSSLVSTLAALGIAMRVSVERASVPWRRLTSPFADP
ncbi:MAG: rod shape-determining protein RodA, partial [Zetaproteobacteria bacterium]